MTFRLISQSDCTWVNRLISQMIVRGQEHHQHRHWDNSQRLKQFQTSHIFMKQMLFCPFTCGISKVLTIVLLSLSKWLNPLLRRQQQQRSSAVEANLDPLIKTSAKYDGIRFGAKWKSSATAVVLLKARSSHSPRDVRSSGSIGNRYVEDRSSHSPRDVRSSGSIGNWPFVLCHCENRWEIWVLIGWIHEKPL